VAAAHPLRQLREVCHRLVGGHGVRLVAGLADLPGGVRERVVAELARPERERFGLLAQRAHLAGGLGVLQGVDRFAEPDHEGVDLQLDLRIVLPARPQRGLRALVGGHAGDIGRGPGDLNAPRAFRSARRQLDQIEGEGGVADINENAGARYFKLKLNGNPEADAARLIRIGRELATLPHDYSVTLDANEQYADLAALGALVERLDRDAGLRPIAAKLLYIEQPMPRDSFRQSPLGQLARRDIIIDEADDSYDAFPAARALGYRGISSKSCKGIYKSIVNATRAAKWSADGERYFISGEDLTCQAGLGVQQDLALGALIGVTHAERNGHHYVDGFADTPAAEAEAFLSAHPDLYIRDGARIRLSIHDGDLLTGSLTGPGFASKVHPDWTMLSPLQQPRARTLQEQSI